jgi:hypothetical protein
LFRPNIIYFATESVTAFVKALIKTTFVPNRAVPITKLSCIAGSGQNKIEDDILIDLRFAGDAVE